MSFSLIKHLCDALNQNESALSKIGISIYDSEGKIKKVTAIFEEIAEFWDKDLEGKIKNDCN